MPPEIQRAVQSEEFECTVDRATFFGSANDREVKRLQGIVAQINALEPDVEKLSDDQLRARTDEFREKYKDGADLDDRCPLRSQQSAKPQTTLGQRHYDVQMLGGMVLHQGKISEMRTGEGKTLVATLPVYLNAITGKGVHVVTVNDYLASRDAEWMGEVYEFLGLTVGFITHAWKTRNVRLLTRATLPMAPTTNSALIICATI